MQRLLKYRAWDEENGQFIFAELFPRLEEPFVGRLEKGASVDTKHTCPKRLNWEEFTGKYGKDRKEIYENDVIKLDSRGYWLVEKRGCEWVLRKDEEGGIEWRQDLAKQPSHWLEVIGNIHQNKALLSNT